MRIGRRPKGVVAWVRTGKNYMDLNDSLSQAVQALELASELAVSSGSSEGLTGVAHGWMRMSETIHGITSRANDIEASQELDRPQFADFGFRAPAPPKIDGDEPIAEEKDI